MVSQPVGRCLAGWMMFTFALLAGGTAVNANELTNRTNKTANERDDRNQRVVTPNFQQAEQYSTRYLRQFVYSTSVSPNWIGETDEFWYSFKTSEGTRYWRVHPERKTRLPLFDHVKMAAQVSELTRQPVEPLKLNLPELKVDTENDLLQFKLNNLEYVYSLKTELLSKKEKPEDKKEADDEPESVDSEDQQQDRRRQLRDDQERTGQTRGEGATQSGRSARNDAHRSFSPDRKSYVFAKGHDLYFVKIPEKQVDETDKAKLPGEDSDATAGDAEKHDSDKEQQDDQKKEEQEKENDQTQGVPYQELTEIQTQEVNQDQQKQEEQEKQDEKKVVQKTDQTEVKQDKQTQEEKKEEKKEEEQEDKKEQKKEEEKEDKGKEEEQKETEDGQQEQQSDDETADSKADDAESKKDAFDPKWDELAVRLSTDGEASFSFAGQVTQRGASREIKEDTLTRPSVTWAKNSQSFYVSRRDSRGVEELWVINSLSTPRPKLESYAYPMPGEENVRKTHLFWFDADQQKLTKVKKKWKDEFYSDIRYDDAEQTMKFLRRDRLLRNLEYCSLDLKSGEATCLFEEGFEKATIAPKGVRFLKNGEEMIWWSERTGWGHFFLYDIDGNLKNAITAGDFFADRIVSLDEENRIMYFTAMGREPGENLNNKHLYSVRLDGRDLKLMDPGDADHSSVLSPTKRFLVDNHSRVDMAPRSVLRNSDGKEIMMLEEADLSRLEQVGWKIPETFIVKAADGVTDLFGNMYKPFDFDPNKRYPIITYVYPGPQQEGTRHSFTATAGEQQLAQVGFIVIQVGHRGGTPGRSKAYASYGYNNLRDYALADKKAAIEQLAQQFPFIDVERVGMYGHSGGGFMTAAALMVPPYNDFFKAGFSTAGNHDNNIYNNSWSERWHGLKEVAVEESSNSNRGRTNSRQTQQQSRQRGGPSDLRGNPEVDPDDFFYEYEMANDEDWTQFEMRLWGQSEQLPLFLLDELQEQEQQRKEEEQQVEEQQVEEQRQQRGQQRGQRGQRRQRQEQEQEQEQEKQEDQQKNVEEQEQEKQEDQQKNVEEQDKELKQDVDQQDQKKEEDQEQEDDQEKDEDEDDVDKKVKFEIRIPTNAELAENLKHHLFLVHGELDNNVHPANTLRVVDALIKANKKFDMLYLPGTRHGFGSYQPYVTQRMFEFFADKLMTEYQTEK